MDIYLINTKLVSIPIFTCIQYALNLIDKGYEPDIIKEKVEEYGKQAQAFFSVISLDNLVRGGRLSKVSYFMGNLLKIKPILRLGDGVLTSFAKARGIEKVRQSAFDIALENYKPDDTFNYYIGHTVALEDAKLYETKLKENFPNATGEIIEIGSALGIHTGPGCLLMYPYTLPEV